jgi:GDP-L-fucose synthase
MIRETVGCHAKIVYDASKPDGTPRKLLDVALIRSLGWQARIPLKEGLRTAYASFLGEQKK